MKQIKYGILGCGEHALRSHAIPCRDVKELELLALCDISEERMNLFQEQYEKDIQTFTDRDKFFRSGIEAVLIATPDEFHYQDLVDAQKYGLHAFVEKPLIVNSDELDKLEQVLYQANKSNTVISSCHLRRYDPPFVWLKDNISLLIEKLGKPLQFGFDFSYHRPMKTWKHARGLLLDHLNHEIDLLTYVFGHNSFEARKLGDTYDSYHVIGKRKDGISFDFSGTRRLENKEYLEWTKIRFERGNLFLDAHNGTVQIHNHENNTLENYTIKPTDYDARGRETIVNFANAINKIEKCYLSPEDLYVNNAASVMLTKNDYWRYDKNG